jgi:hypothetical protein
VDLWTMRFAHRPACRGQRVALTTAPTFDHKLHRLPPLCETLNPRYKIYRDDNHCGAGGFPGRYRSAIERPSSGRRRADGVSCWGDILANAAAFKRIRGSVIDGMRRDIASAFLSRRTKSAIAPS